jgi:hypothetical protein
MSRDSRYLESILHHDIPLTREMGLKVIDWQDRRLQLHLPLDANINHKSTMFGGSLYCGAVLAGWGWLHLQLREEGIEDGHIVIQEGQISYPMRRRFARHRMTRCGSGFWRPINGMAGRAWRWRHGSSTRAMKSGPWPLPASTSCTAKSHYP